MGGHHRLLIRILFLLSQPKRKKQDNTPFGVARGGGAYRLRMTPVCCLVKNT